MLYHRLGHGSEQGEAHPRRITSMYVDASHMTHTTPWYTHVAAGPTFSAAVNSNGEIYTWGSSRSDPTNTPTPQPP